MDPADSWERLGNALLGPFERDIIDGLTGAYRAMEPRIEQAFKRSLDTGNDTALKQLLILRQQLGQELSAMQLPPELAQTVNQALLDGQVSSDFWALAEMNRVKQEARKLSPEEAAQAFANATDDADLLLSPAMVQQNPSAMIAAAQRQNALSNYAAGGRGTQAFASLNRLVDVDLRGRIIGAVEFHLAQGDSWRQLRGTLQNSLELTKSRAQTIARTEMAAAMVEGTKLRYETEGIQQVQWQAVGSSRTCGYCAPRHGKVYKLGDVVAPAHPNCRCTITPFDPKWVELGLIDLEQEAKARADVLADLEASGKKPISGPSPFEKALNREQAPVGQDLASFAAKPKAAPKPKAPPKPKPVPAPPPQPAPAPKPTPKAKPAPAQPVTPPKLKSEVTSATRKVYTTDDIDFDYSKNWEKLGYENKSQFRRAKADIDQWSGDDYRAVRAAQFDKAKKDGIQLNAYEERQRRLLEKGDDRYYGRMAERLEEFVDRAPKFKGTLHRGVSLDSREAVDAMVTDLAQGNKSLALESWTADQRIAQRFANGDGAPMPHRVRIEVEGNRYGAPINSISGFGDEAEVLVPSGVRYEVIEVKSNANEGNKKSSNPLEREGWTDHVIRLRQLP